jgi:hypothetical protein
LTRADLWDAREQRKIPLRGHWSCYSHSSMKIMTSRDLGLFWMCTYILNDQQLKKFIEPETISRLCMYVYV